MNPNFETGSPKPENIGIKTNDNEDEDEILEDSDEENEKGDQKVKTKVNPNAVVSRNVPDQEDDEEYSTMHKIYIKGSPLDIEGLDCVPFYKLKPVNKIFSLFGVIFLN